MAYITPNSDVVILKGVPLDRSYNHTLYNASANAQYTAIYAYKKYTLDKQTYQRAGKGKIRVGILADNLYDCNYIMFRNTSYGSKWFYAFIDSVEYVNDNASEINYTIDVMQTWYFDYELGACFVEREHSLTDNFHENLVPEDISGGEMVVESESNLVYPTAHHATNIRYSLLIFYVPNYNRTLNDAQYITGYSVDLQSGKPIVETDSVNNPTKSTAYTWGTLYNDLYMGCYWFSIPIVTSTTSDIAFTKEVIQTVVNKILGNDIKGQIVNMCQIPNEILTTWMANSGDYTETKYIDAELKFYNTTKQNYYLPKNKKLYTYPYKSIKVSNNNGNVGEYKWEMFANVTTSPILNYPAQFILQASAVPTCEVICYPYFYDGVQKYYDNGVVLSDFPSVSWSEDSFTKWWSQNKENYMNSLMSTAISGIATYGILAMTGEAIGSAAIAAGSAGSSVLTTLIGKQGAMMGTKVSTSLSIKKLIADLKTQKNVPDQMYGQINASALKPIQNRVGFTFYDMGVEMETAKVIDDYFTMFGYAVKRVKVPNVRATGVTLRPHWNYIKTTACIIHSASGKGLPAEDEEAISNIYDNGITFWNTISEIGDYTLNNSPTT